MLGGAEGDRTAVASSKLAPATIALGGILQAAVEAQKRPDCAKGGRSPFKVLMFNILLLQPLYKDQAEFQIG
jgi:hypothetical protein